MTFSWAYIAGFFDGEGSVSIASSNSIRGITPNVTICQSGDRGKLILSNLKEFLEAEGIKTNNLVSRHPGKLGKKRYYALSMMRRESVIEFLSRVMPWLRIKKLESQDLVRYLKLFPRLPRGGHLAWESRRGIK